VTFDGEAECAGLLKKARAAAHAQSSSVRERCLKKAVATPTGATESSAAGSSSEAAAEQTEGGIMPGGIKVAQLHDLDTEPHLDVPCVIEGTGGDIDSVPGSLRGRRVVIVGFGAFAVENARTALLSGAAHVTIVARSLNLVMPRLAMYFGFTATSTIETGVEIAERLRREARERRSDGWTTQLLRRTAGVVLPTNLFMTVITYPYRTAGAEAALPGPMRNAPDASRSRRRSRRRRSSSSGGEVAEESHVRVHVISASAFRLRLTHIRLNSAS
jgi:hypothetical protein